MLPLFLFIFTFTEYTYNILYIILVERPWFLPSRIPDPKSATKERGEKIFVVIPFFIAINLTICDLFYVWNAEHKNAGHFQRIIELFTQKFVTKLSKIWVWDPGSETRKKPIPDPGSRGQKGTGSRIRIRNTGRGVIHDLPWPGDVYALVSGGGGVPGACPTPYGRPEQEFQIRIRVFYSNSFHIAIQ